MSKILVTGGAGFVGSHLCARLQFQGHDVISVDNYSTGSIANHVPGVRYVNLDTNLISSLDFEPDMIYHLGEYSRVEQSFSDLDTVFDSNVSGTFEVLKFALKHKARLLYAGSSTKFGNNGADSSPYAWSKSSNTQLVKNFSEWYGLDYVITYFYNVYGPREIETGDYATLIGIFKNRRLNLLPLNVTLPGTQQRNFTHVSDIVNGLVLVGERGSGDGYGIGSPEKFTVEEVAKMFGGEIKYTPEKRGNRMSAELVTAKTEELGWKAKRSLPDYIQEILK